MPELSIAIVAKGPGDPAPFWDALQQGGFDDPRVDVHLAYDASAPPAGMPAWVTGHHRAGVSLFGLSGLAIAYCRAPYVALLQIHAVPSPDWLGAMLAAIRSGGPIYWGPVEELYAGRDTRIIGYLVEYAQFHRPIAAQMPEVPGNNIVMLRSLAGPEAKLLRDGFSKTAHLEVWRREGLPMTRVDEAVVIHRRAFALGAFCARRFRHGRAFGAKRASDLPPVRRMVSAATMVMLPAVRVARILGHTSRVPKVRRAAWTHLGAMIAAETAWSAGEAVGYLRRSAGDPDLID